MSKQSELHAKLLKIDETIVEITLEMVSLHAARLPLKHLEERRLLLVQEWSDIWTKLEKLPSEK